MTDGLIAQLYTKVRSSNAFLIGLCSFCSVWLFLSWKAGFDKDHGLINLILSAEASISLAFFALIGEKQYRAIMELLSEVKATLVLIKQVLEAIKAEEDDILRRVEHDEL